MKIGLTKTKITNNSQSTLIIYPSSPIDYRYQHILITLTQRVYHVQNKRPS